MFRSFYLFIAFLFFAIIVRAQEKRVALVIGNADYIYASSLKNPINDAELMKTTLASLGFEVIEAKNLKTQRQFLDTIRSFQRKSASYNVRFLYYAGHAVQIGEENYLLPTEEKYQNATDFKDYAIPLGLITKEFTAEENLANVINVVILDACRDNPNKNVESRGVVIESLYKERSSNEVLIAYATTSGETAADGLKDGKNSVFCSSLAKHMMLADVPFEEVLKKVRIDVKKALNQQPEYLNRLDNTLYLKKSSYTDQIVIIDSLIDKRDYNKARAKIEILLDKAPDYKLALLRKARIEYNDINKNYDGAHLFRADSLYPNDPEVLEYLGRYYSIIGEDDKAINSIGKAIKIESNDPQLYYWRARFFEDNNEFQLAEVDYTKAIELDQSNAFRYDVRSIFYSDSKKDIEKALDDNLKAIELEPNNEFFFYGRGLLYHELKKYDHAIQNYKKAIQINPSYIDAINSIGVIYEEEGRMDLAIETYTEGISLEETNPQAAAFCYHNRAVIHENQGRFSEALNDYSKAIELDASNAERYHARSIFYSDSQKDVDQALDDNLKAIELDPNNELYHFLRGLLYHELKKNDRALQNYKKALQINPSYLDAINNIGLIYEEEGSIDLAIETYTEVIALEKTDPLAAAYCCYNRAIIYENQGKFSEALKDYSKSIELDPTNPERYASRSEFYASKQDFEKALEDISKAIEIDPNEEFYYAHRGYLYYELKKNDRAIENYKKALLINPNSVGSIYGIGNIYQMDGKMGLAIETFTEGIALEKIDPITVADCYSERARIYQNQGKLENALKDYSKAIELDSKNGERFVARGSFYKDVLKRPYDALVDYSLAISLDSTETNYLWNRGKLFSEKLNNQELAIQDFNQILKIKPNDINALNWRTIFYDRNNDLENAKAGYQKIISLVDSIKKLEKTIEDYGWANINLAEIYQCENKIEEALSLYNEGVSYNSEYPESYYWRAWFLALYMSKYDLAISDLSTSIKLEPKNPHWLLNRSKIYQMKGDLKDAKNDINEAVKISNESAIYIAERGNFYSITGEYDKATKDFKESLKLDSANRRTYHLITEDLIRQGKIDDAIKNATASNILFKNDTVSFEQLGRIYFAKNDFYKSLSSYFQAASIMEFNEGDRTIYPHDIQVFLSDVHLKIAEIYKKLNQSNLECEALRKAKEIVFFETRPDRQKMIIEIQEKLKYCQN